MRRRLAAGGVLAALWIVCGWLSFWMLSRGGSIATVGLLVPSPMARGVFGSPMAWAVLAQVLTVVAVVAGYALIVTLLARRGAVTFAAGWIGAVLLGFAIGAAMDVGAALTYPRELGFRSALNAMGVTPVTTWWALIVGWIPALIARSAQSGSPERADAAGTSRPLRMLMMSLVTAAALVALPLVTHAGHDAIQQQLRQDQADAEAAADPDGAAAPDPDAPGHAVPDSIPAEGTAPRDACTAQETTLMAPAPDAATGHRGQIVQVVNTGDEPCTLDGYPDVAYGDQNEHLLDVTIDHGGSFMTTDPGPALFTLAPGESAFAGIGWDANSMHGQLVASSQWIAVRPGEHRSVWPMRVDIIPGTTVHVTAWQPGSPADAR